MVPEPQNFDALRGEKSFSLFVVFALIGKAVATTIKFHGEFCDRAIEIQEVITTGILTSEFELIKSPVAQQTP